MNPSTSPGYGLLPVGNLSEEMGVSVNPDPIVLEETDIMANDFLSPGKLQEITGREDIENVKMLEMVVNTTETTLGNFGHYLPCLTQLKLSNSVIPSVRDIGTSLSHLKVLWMSCCGLHDVDGIASMLSLSELYLAYNDIEDISPISFLDNLEVLDLEGNRIADQEQFDYLAILTQLRTLSLSGNPVCQILNKKGIAEIEENSYDGEISLDHDILSYREVVMKKVPQLIYLDDEKCMNGTSVHSGSSSDHQPSLAMSSHSQEDIDLINNAIKEGLISEEYTNMYPDMQSNHTGKPSTPIGKRPGSAGLRRPMSALSGQAMVDPNATRLRSPLARPLTAIPGGRSGSAGALRTESLLQKAANSQRPNSSGSGDVNLQDESSNLTFGEVICGNPTRALRSRKTSPMPVLSLLQNEDQPTSYDHPVRPATAAVFRRRPVSGQLEDVPGQSRNDVFAELKDWRSKHEERISTLKADVQILKIDEEGGDSTDKITLDSDATDSEADEILDLDAIPGLQDDGNDPALKNTQTTEDSDAALTAGTSSSITHEGIRLHSPSSQCRAQVRSPPPKNLSPSSHSSLSPRNSPASPRSPIFSSSQLDGATVPVLRGSPKNRSSELQGKSTVKHLPAPPKVGAPRPKTASDFRNLHLRRSLTAVTHEAFVPLASPMTLPQASKRQNSSQEVKQ